MAGLNRRAAKLLGNRAPSLGDHAKQDPSGNPRSADSGGGERRRVKAREQQIRHAGRPIAKEHISNDLSGLRLSSPHSLQLDICAQTEFGHKRQSLSQSGHAFRSKSSPEPSPCAEATNRFEGQRACLAVAIGCSAQPIVVEQNWLAIASQADIELDPPATQRLCSTESR